MNGIGGRGGGDNIYHTFSWFSENENLSYCIEIDKDFPIQDKNLMNKNTDNNIRISWKFFSAGLASLIAAYAMMAIFSSEFIRLTASPIIVLIGFLLLAFSIFKTK
mgnify:CR=1 FL=1